MLEQFCRSVGWLGELHFHHYKNEEVEGGCWIAQGHTDSKWWNQDFTLGLIKSFFYTAFKNISPWNSKI